MKNSNYIELQVDGKERYIKTGNRFIIPDYRRDTFIYYMFECVAIGKNFISPPTIKKQFQNKVKVWLINFNLRPDEGENGFYQECNDDKTEIVRFYQGTDYQGADYKFADKSTDNLFMIFNTRNNYEFLGLFRPQPAISTTDYIYVQKFIKVADDIRFTPSHPNNKQGIGVVDWHALFSIKK